MTRLLQLFGLAALISLSFNSAAAKYQEISVTDGGTITGVINFSGDDAPPKSYRITKDNEACGTGTVEIDYVRVNEGRLTDVVVYLDKIKQGKPFSKESEQLQINQVKCDFGPLLQVMRNNSKLIATNQDAVLHNVHTYELLGRAKRTVINVSQPDQGDMTKSTVKLRRGNAMKVECDAHDFMHAFIFVAKNPYYAVVAEDGTFSIENVPAGEYSIGAWHGTLKNQKGKVVVNTNGTTNIDFTFK